jgi:hypothetical protein
VHIRNNTKIQKKQPQKKPFWCCFFSLVKANMAGGLMQLVAYGAQDVYLTGTPKVTFFQAVYKRHTNFAMELIQQTTSGTVGNGGRVSITIARNGDLVGNMHVALTPVAPSATVLLTSTNSAIDTNWIAERAISTVELTIGGQRIDKHYQLWWRLYSEVFLNEADKIAWGKMTSMSNPNTTQTYVPKVYLPLLFFFNRNPGLYLPLIALQYHEVRLDFDLTQYYASYFSTGSSFEVWANYIYLDTEERRRFAQKGHEYLIEQLQHTGGDTLSASGTQDQPVRLTFNHPVKELIWCYQNPTSAAQQSSAYNGMWNFCSTTANVNVTCDPTVLAYSGIPAVPHAVGAPRLYTPSFLTAGQGVRLTSNAVAINGLNSGASAFISNVVPSLFYFQSNVISGNVFWVEEGTTLAGTANTSYGVEVGPLNSFKVVLNGQDRFAAQGGKYFNQVQPFYHHTGTPYPGIYVYSFALQPEEHQPTGTCNFSRIDNASVTVNLKTSVQTTSQKMFAVNYNVLRIASGMGGLAFSN